MLEFKIEDPEIEEVYSSEEIVRLLKSLVRKEVQIVPMDKKEILSFSYLENLLKEYFFGKPIIRAYLFGSYAKGQAKENSDIDILVELDYSLKIGTLFFRMQAELEEFFKKKVDLLSFEAIPEKLRESVLSEKLLVYERNCCRH